MGALGERMHVLPTASSSTFGQSCESYGVHILVRRDLQAMFWRFPLPTHMGRECLVADIGVEDCVVRIATVHLESCRENAYMRGKQLDAILPQISSTIPVASTFRVPSSVVLCG